MNNDGYIKLHRSITEWEWYDDIPTKVLFLHLLITANWKTKKWRGITIKRGQILTSISQLAKQTQLSVQQVRTSLSKLELTSEVTKSTTSTYTIITIKNYGMYQSGNKGSNKGRRRFC